MCVRACVVCACTYLHMNPFCTVVIYSVQVAPKVSTSHYTMAVIMYMRVSEEGKEGKGGKGRGRGRGGERVKERRGVGGRGGK